MAQVQREGERLVLDTQITEPILTTEDHRIWDMWHKTSLLHARLRSFRNRVDSAKRIIKTALKSTEYSLAIMLSGGKDSVCMTHLAVVELGLSLDAISEKDDMDYPGELEYIKSLARTLKLNLKVVTPAVSMKELIKKLYQSGITAPTEDVHGRATNFSSEHFYKLIERASSKYRGIMLGLRANESRARKMNFYRRGSIYLKKSGKIVCTPLITWSGLDVMAYMFSRGIEPLPVYKCIAFMHSREPWRIRKSWWLPGANSRFGGVAWLRRYYPSLYAELVKMCPETSMLA